MGGVLILSDREKDGKMDGRTDMTKATGPVHFSDYVKAPKTGVTIVC